MTDIDQVAMEMEFSSDARRRLAEELTRLRRLESTCRQHHRRLLHQVQTALRAPALETEFAPPAECGSSADLLQFDARKN